MASNVNQHNQLLQLFAAYAKRLDKLYDDFVNRLIAALPYSEDEVWERLATDPLFRFDELPYLSARLQHIFDDYVNKQVLCYKAGITDGVALAFSQDKINLGKYTILQDEAIKAARNAAVASFIANRMSRKEGLSLSDKVWNYSQLGKSEVEMGISNVLKDGLKAGTSAEELGRKVRQYLNNPTMMYRRYWVTVADHAGNKKKVARWYRRHIDEKTGKVTFSDEPLEKVGMGVYRSARMNGYRLMRTEINMSYHKANASRWANEPFVRGIRVWKSPQHPKPDICDELEGYYPKDFVFEGWHPACMCASAPVTLYGDEKREFYRRLMEGEDMSNFHSKEEITEENMNPNWKRYIETNHDAIKKAASRGKLAYFLRDNKQFWINTFSKAEQREMGMLKSIKEIADARHAARTEEQVKDIADRWHAHKRVDALIRQARPLVAELKEYPLVGNWRVLQDAIDERNEHTLKTLLADKLMPKKLAYEKLITPKELEWSEFVKNFTTEETATWVQNQMTKIVREARKETSLLEAKNDLAIKATVQIRNNLVGDELKAYQLMYDREVKRMEDWFDFQHFTKNLTKEIDLINENARVIGGAFKEVKINVADFYLQDIEKMKELVNDKYFKPYINLNEMQQVSKFVATTKSPIVHQLWDGIINAYRTQGMNADVDDFITLLKQNVDRLEKEAARKLARKEAKEASPLMNEKLKKHGEYLGKDDDYVFDRSFFDMLEKKYDVEIPHKGGGSYESGGTKIVLDNDERGKKSLWEKYAVVYHEGGHAIADQRHLFYRDDLIQLREKMIDKLNKRYETTVFAQKWDAEKHKYIVVSRKTKQSGFEIMDTRLHDWNNKLWRMDKETFAKYGITKDDAIEALSSFADTIKSLNPRYAWGHSREYFANSSTMRRHEFIAHCFENTFIGNPMFEHFMPQEYRDTIALIRKWQKEIADGTYDWHFDAKTKHYD